MHAETEAPKDLLGEGLYYLRMSGTFYCRSDLTAPWGLTLPAMPECMWFHVVTSGRCRLEVDGAQAQVLQPGDFALVPHGEGHHLRSGPDATAPIIYDIPHEFISDRYAVLRHGGGGDAVKLVCGAVRFDHPAAHNLLNLLPRMIYVEASGSPDTEWMQSTLRLMATEARRSRPGGETVITRLSDILVIQAIRSWIGNDPAARTGWLGALRDPQIGRAISMIHRDPARAWTVGSLAAAVAMSRSAFAARFTALVQEPAMQYVTRWRMQIAVHELRQGGAAVGELANRLGYQSEAAFSRAFKRTIGVPPGAITRNDTPMTLQEHETVPPHRAIPSTSTQDHQ